MSQHVTAAAVWDDDRLRLIDPVTYRAQLRRLKLGPGEAVSVRVEREAEAWRHSDVRGLFGFVYRPVAEFTGISVADLHAAAKGLWLPDDGRTSITQLNREELQQFRQATEGWLREDIWEAFEQFDAENYLRHRGRSAA